MKAEGKGLGSPIEVEVKLGDLRMVRASGMRSGAVKCIHIKQNPDCEGSLPSHD